MSAISSEFIHSSPELSTDELLRRSVSKHLGKEASERFFTQLQHEDNLSRRAQYLVRAAELLELFDADSAVDTPKIEAVPSESLFMADIASEPNPRVESLAVEVPRVENTKPTEKQSDTTTEIARTANEIENDFSVDTRISDLLDAMLGEGASAQLGLTAGDKDVIVRTLMEVRGSLGPRGIPETFVQMLEGVYDGASQKEIAKSLRVTSAAAWQKWKSFATRCIENSQHDTLGMPDIMKRIRPESIERDVSVADEGATRQDTANEPTPDDTSLDIKLQESGSQQDVSERFDELLDELTDQDNALVESLQALLVEDDFDVERMSRGASLLNEIMSKYAPNRGGARGNIGVISENAYKVLRNLADSVMRSSNQKPRTLPKLLKYNHQTNEEQVMDHLNRLFEVAIKDKHVLGGVKLQERVAPIPTPPIPTEQLSTPRRAAELQVTPPSIDLFQVAKDHQKLGQQEWRAAVDRFFESIVTRKIFASYQVELLKLRALGEQEGLSKDIDDTTREVLNILQQKAREPGCKINEDEETRHVFDLFTITALGVNTIEDIQRKLKKDSKREVNIQTVRRRVVAGLAAALGSE
ncbi:MAG: hypothetical protein UY35_C0007G0053 [Candidatus Saccharibacteria bacterium GW2011_GWC2_48_9]|nr:MAG: hypothetical protein UY35_C0007G0053 [Candidatus Saccharibacteria bacterium GW2011_GWC2_48_9]HCH34705.1 hypothetical protein [Candidatus Saccharibacteria bacterium]